MLSHLPCLLLSNPRYVLQTPFSALLNIDRLHRSFCIIFIFLIIVMRGLEIIIPPLFRCPISLDLIEDPVTLWTGQTYDRSCIEKWLAAGNLTCPVTMQKLQDSSMVPNHTLRHLIHDWLHSNGYSDNCLDDQASIGRIKRVVESDEFGFHEKILALEEVYSLCQELPIKNTRLIKLDFFKILIEQVFRNVGSLLLVEKSLSCALKLMPFSDLECLNILKEDSNHAVLLRLFEEGGFSIKKGLCLMVEAISSEVRTRNLCEKIAKSTQLDRAIIRIINQFEESEDEYEVTGAAVRALTALSSIESNRKSIARNGAIEGLIACLTYAESRKKSLAAVAMAAIEILLSEIVAREALLNHPSGVRAVVKMVFRVSEHEGSESAVNALVIVCSECEAARETAIGGGVLTQLLLLLQSQCNARIKSKARLLLKLLRSK